MLQTHGRLDQCESRHSSNGPLQPTWQELFIFYERGRYVGALQRHPLLLITSGTASSQDSVRVSV